MDERIARLAMATCASLGNGKLKSKDFDLSYRKPFEKLDITPAKQEHIQQQFKLAASLFSKPKVIDPTKHISMAPLTREEIEADDG